MAVGVSEPKKLNAVAGVELASVAAGIRYAGRDDMVLVRLSEGATTAAVFTQNHFCAAPVTLARRHLSQAQPRALLINSGNANAGTGAEGLHNAERGCALVAELLEIQATEVLPFSTGVIGAQLPMTEFEAGARQLPAVLAEANWLSAARAIMTTDTVAKGVSEQLEIDGKPVVITGIAKGSGMICPNMATLLAYVATDVAIPQVLLQGMLQRANAMSFNRISVDGDTSTNDALVLMASGSAGVEISEQSSPQAKTFYQALERVMVALATQVVRDAEGATKFVKVTVDGAANEADAVAIAYSVAHSPLVKTALFASDPNWGRILAAVGKADVSKLDIDRLNILINGTLFIERGQPSPDYCEAIGQAIFNQSEIEILVQLNVGDAQHHVWTSDLSHDYVSINADYRS